MKEVEVIKIFDRNFMYITRAQADTLEYLRYDSFNGKIDANTCESEAYKFIFDDNTPTHKDGEIFGLVKRVHHMDVGTIWIANHTKKTITYDGIRSIRLADELRHMSSENPPLISLDEFRSLVEHCSKYFGVFYYRPENKISIEEFEAAKKTIELYEAQLLFERRSRAPVLGDLVVCINGVQGRYIGKGQAIYTSDYLKSRKEVERDLVDMDVAWENKHSLPLPTDKDVLEYINKNKWLNIG